MKIGDQVEVRAEVTVTPDDVGTVKALEYGRVTVEFPDGWTRSYHCFELRVVEPQAKGAAS